MKNLFLIFFQLFAIIGFSQNDSTFTIEGRLYDEEISKPYRKQKIYLIQNELKIDSTFSNWRGNYRFKNLKKDCYSVVTESYQMLIENDKICFENGGRRVVKHNFFKLNPIYTYSFSPTDSSNIFKLRIEDNNGTTINDFEYKIISTNNPQVVVGIFEKIDTNRRKLVQILRYKNLIEAIENSIKLQEKYPKDRFKISYPKDIPFAISPIELTLYQYTYYMISINKDGYKLYNETIKIKSNQVNYEYVITLKKVD